MKGTTTGKYLGNFDYMNLMYSDPNISTASSPDNAVILNASNNSAELSINGYYQGVSGITNPLKKNNVYHKTNDSKNKSVKDSLVDLKNEVKYINKSLKEIENPTPAGFAAFFFLHE